MLSDGHRYAEWVQGTRRIRGVDPEWPAVGASIHFTVGVGPLSYDGKTTSRRCLVEQVLELEAHAWPAGTVRVGLRISPAPNGSVVSMNEHPLRGPARWLHTPLASAGWWVRVRSMLADLVRLAERERAV